jgi:signal transduction histidine kinase
MINALRLLHNKLIGDSRTISIQARIFHQVSIIALVGLPVAILINLFIKVPDVNLIMLGMTVFIGLLYLNSRYLGNLRARTIIYTCFVNLIVTVNYFYNSGVQGPTLMLFMLSLVFTLAITPKKQYFFWAIFNTCFVVLLLYIEYSNGLLVKHSYPTKESYFIDIGFSYVAIISCIAFIISYILKSYRSEKDNALKASIELKAANDSKTKLLSILSHDLRSPLNSIQSFLELLLEYDLEENEQKAIKSSLLKETKNTQAMLFNLLSWTKSQMDGGVKVKLVKVNLYDTLKVAIEIQQTAAMEKMITVENKIDRDICVVADLDMLKLVVRNLINNAIKFTNSGGEIAVSTEVKDQYGILYVRDNGIGISEEKQRSIFSMESETTYGTKNEKGVGLGLLLCKEFTDLQGGRISFSSSENVGTVFQLTFPLFTSDEDSTIESFTRHSLFKGS